MTFAPSRTTPEFGARRAGQKVDERRLSRAVGPDDPDSVAAHDPHRKVAHDFAIAIRFADLLRVDHQRARRLGVLRHHGGDADRPQGFAALASEIRELADTPHVALAARSDAVAHPMLFVDDLAVELVALELLLLELHVAPGLERAKTLIEAAGAAAIEPDRGAGQVGKQPFVVADQRERRTAIREVRLQPFDRDQIEMIGRLVEQQDLGLRAQDPDQRRAARFAAGETAGIGVRIDPELGHHGSRRIRIVEIAKPGKDIVERGGEAGHVRLLRQIGEAR